jgi:16S rRNA (uracil1498-N3)-methyltransferase
VIRVLTEDLTREEVLLDADATHHLMRVRRVAVGATLAVSDGTSAEADGLLVAVDGGRARLRLSGRRTFAPATRVVILGVPRPALVEEAVQLGTEAGATLFVLVRADRSPPGDAREDRLARVAREAVLQSGRPDLPRCVRAGSLAEAVAHAAGTRWVGDPGGPAALSSGGAFTVAIGPEGGLSGEERRLLLECGFARVGLGPHILRAPTAVAVAVAKFSLKSAVT